MKKEVIVAIVSGLILGLVITLGIYTANKALEKQRLKKTAANHTLPLPSPLTSDQAKTLNLIAPQPFDLINQSEVTLSGVAWPDAVVALMSETDNFITQADSQGDFVFTFKLVKGFNEITVLASDPTTPSQTQTLVLTYSTTKLEPLEETTQP